MAKDRAAPFSRKHRRYWFTVTGGMLLIGGINLAIGLCSYHPPSKVHQPILYGAAPADAAGTLSAADLPVAVMRAFNLRYPKTIPSGAIRQGDSYVVNFPPGSTHTSATFRADGTFVSER